MFNQNIKKKQKLILAAIFIFVFAAGFGFSTHVHAKSCECASKEDWERGNFIYLTPVDQPTKEACAQYCNSNNQTANFKFDNGSDEIKKTTGEIVQQQMGDTVCGMGMGDIISLSVLINFVKCLLLYVLLFLEKMLEVSSTLFIWILDAKNFTDVMSNPIIYQIWGMVRDTLNISFILVLLFSAFCTVFQVEKFNYKKILLTLIIMALLVNFSFPIARVIIDFSNIIMYYFAKALGFDKSAGSWFAEIAKNSNLDLILHPPQKIGADLSFLIAAVIFSFILAVTLLIIAILFIIRLVALTILVIFSSIAFVGSIVPFLSSYASKWWDMLFKYAFFGPIMLFMLVVATRMMGAISYTKGSMNAITGQSASDPGFIAAASFFAIPIVILWIGIGTAQTMSIAGASAVVGRGQKFMGWAGKTLTPAGFAMGAWESYRTRRKEAQKDWWRNRLGTFAGSQQDRLFGVASKDARLRYQRDLSQKVENESKRNDMENKTPDELRQLASSKDKFVRAAALKELANKNALYASGVDKIAYEQMRKEFGTDSQVFNQINNKLKAYDPETAFSHLKSDPANWESAIKAYLNSNQSDPKKWSSNVFANENILELAFSERAINMDTLLEAKGKGEAYKKNIENSLDKLATSGKFNLNTDEVHKNIQKAYTAVWGKIADDSFTENIFKTGNKDTLKELDFGSLTTSQRNSFTENINSGKIKEIVQNISSNQTKRDIISYFKASTTPLGINGQSTLKVIKKDLYLNNLA
ncbi:MAG TPA: hypothetical protein P5262_00215 [Candidatus Moranbacteria bacterium]|nr:hypothetical protein [Candidatus Moranbacteria bacterium]